MSISRARTLAENIDLRPVLLSHFEIIIPLLDTPDEERDTNKVAQTLASLSGKGGNTPAALLPMSPTTPKSISSYNTTETTQAVSEMNVHHDNTRFKPCHVSCLDGNLCVV